MRNTMIDLDIISIQMIIPKNGSFSANVWPAECSTESYFDGLMFPGIHLK